MNLEKRNREYLNWVQNLKNKIGRAQIKAAISVNSELIKLYWEIGKELFQKQKENKWGEAIVAELSKDLSHEFPNIKGFSKRNLFYMKQFYDYYKSENKEVQQLVAQIPWGHNIKIFSTSKTKEQALFYIKETIENNWSRNVLSMQIESQLFERQGKSINNFSHSLPSIESDLANQTLKDPYLFDFLSLKKDADERSIEEQLIKHITNFLLELGKGFAYIGRQYHIEIGDKDYYLDLLFYHIKLKRYVVIELKIGKFKPEYAGKLNFYLSAIDDTLKSDSDNQTIGILLCKERNKVEAEYALRGMSQPIGIAKFQLSKSIPQDIKSELPTIEDIENATSEIIKPNIKKK